MTTKFQLNYYKHIERIAVALETLVIEVKELKKDQKMDSFRKATNLIYGTKVFNDNKGRSADNYQYPSKSDDGTPWEEDPEVLDLLERMDEPGPGPEEDDTSFTIGGLSNDKDGSFSKFQAKMGARTSPGNFQPDIQSPLDERIYQESQAVTGGEFQDWYHALTPDERESYRRVYGH